MASTAASLVASLAPPSVTGEARLLLIASRRFSSGPSKGQMSVVCLSDAQPRWEQETILKSEQRPLVTNDQDLGQARTP